MAPFLNPGTLDPFLALFMAACHAASTAEAGTVTVSSTAAPSARSLLDTSTPASAVEAAAAVETEARRREVVVAAAREEDEEDETSATMLLLFVAGREARVGSCLIGGRGRGVEREKGGKG